MKEFFKVERDSIEITRLEAHRETKNYIYVRGCFDLGIQSSIIYKDGKCERYFPTHEEAKNHLIERETQRLKSLQAQLEKVEGNLKVLSLPF